MSELITETKLRQLAGEWIGGGKTVVGPVRVKDRVLYRPLGSPESLLIESTPGAFTAPSNSIKEFLFPKLETLYQYRIQGRNIELIEPASGIRGAVDSGGPSLRRGGAAHSRPCFQLGFRRRVLQSPPGGNHDRNPRLRRDRWVLLLHLRRPRSGRHPRQRRDSARARRRAFRGALHDRKGTGSGLRQDGNIGRIGPGRAASRIQVRSRQDSRVCRRVTSRTRSGPSTGGACMACGVCAFSCPTCHCFDIVDAGAAAGNARVRTWDTCQFPIFTLHASGHNPRAAQPARQRQRILHKFSIYPEKFGEILCTGCGNCVRNCPVGLGVLNLLTEIQHGQHL